MGNPQDELLSNPNLNKVEEYFKLKGVIRTLRNDLKDYRAQKEEVRELEKLTKKSKELREKIKEDETIHELSEKISTSKERLDLIREMIRIELLETSREEVKHNGRKLKLVNILKEMKDESQDVKGKSQKGGSIFRN